MSDKLAIGIDIDKSIIEGNVTNLVAAAIAEALGDKEELVTKAVKSILSSYVKESGEPCQSSAWGARPYLHYLAEKTVKDAVKEQVKQAVEENKEVFAAELRRQISMKKFREKMAASFLDCVLEDAKNSWRMPVTVLFDKDRDE